MRILLLQTIEVIADCDVATISADVDHAELALTARSREVAERQTSRPNVSHRLTEEGPDFGPQAGRTGDAAKFTEVGYNVVASKVRVALGVDAGVRIATPFVVVQTEEID